MGTQDQSQHDVDSIVRRAAALGHDPDRVARALNRPDEPAVAVPSPDEAPESAADDA